MGVALRTILVASSIGALVAVATAVILLKFVVEPKAGPQVSQYGVVLENNVALERFTVNSTAGPITIPVPGKINVMTPQFVMCPDVCHWETNVLIYLMDRLVKEGLQDRVVFVTIGVNPWTENLEMARNYIESRAGDYLDKGINWVWVLDDLETMSRLWESYKIYVERVEEENYTTVIHFAGFLIVDENGVLRYTVVPSSKGWQRLDEVAEMVWSALRDVLG